MLFVALRMLTGDRLKYLGLVAGLAFAALLITQQTSILAGMATQTGAWIRDTGQGDLWVIDPQQRFSEDGKTLPDTALYRVRGVDGVEWAVPIYKGWLKARLPDGTKLNVIVVGIDDATLIGGPPTMVHGRLEDLRRDRAVFIDERDSSTKFAMLNDVGPDGEPRALLIGDTFSVNDREVRVEGFMRTSPSFFWDPVIYTTYSRALSMAPPERKLLGQVLVKVGEGQDVASVQAAIERATGLRALTHDEYVEMTMSYILEKTGILINFGLAVGLGFIVGMLVAGQTLYAFVLDNLKHFGALKAMGATNATIVRMVLVQVLAVAALGYGIGLLAATLMGWVIKATDLAFLMTWHIPVFTAVTLAVICAITGVISLAKVLRLEPAIVFRS